MRPVDIAWAAGLFEGEGSICIFEQKDGHHLLPLIRLSIIMTDRDVLEKFCQIAECGKVKGPHQFGKPRLDGEPCKATYVWEIGNRSDVERILLAFRPWLCERRTARADEALAEIAKLDLTCESCGVTFRAHTSRARFCSTKCQLAGYYLAHRSEKTSPTGRPRVL